jgi:transposase
MTKKTTQVNINAVSSNLYVAFEMGSKKWQLGFSTGFGQKTRRRTITAGDLDQLKVEFESAQKRFRLPEKCKIYSCYEAGRDGFWLHRFLTVVGVKNSVVDSASIEVNRRKRRAKSDRLDAESLVKLLMRSMYENKVWSVVRVPFVEDEDRRQLPREFATLVKERTRQRNRIRSLLALHGIRIKGKLDLSDPKLESMTTWDRKPLPPVLKRRLTREWARLEFISEQIKSVQNDRDEEVKDSHSANQQVVQLVKLRSLGDVTADCLVKEVFGWRSFNNGKQVGCLTGLVPTSYQSGESNREQGISKAGITHVRRVAIDLAWNWLRFQPKSKLSLWYNSRFGPGGKKARKVGIVALARKLLISLWRYLTTGEIPEGAELKLAA